MTKKNYGAFPIIAAAVGLVILLAGTPIVIQIWKLFKKPAGGGIPLWLIIGGAVLLIFILSKNKKTQTVIIPWNKRQ